MTCPWFSAPASGKPRLAAARSDAKLGAIYLTDDTFLYRVVGAVAGDEDEIVELEDCYGLDVVEVPLAGLRARGLRVVIPAPAEA